MKNLLLASLLLVSTCLHADSSQIRFSNGWIKQLPPVVPVRAGYLQIKNSSKQQHQIVGIQSEWFERVEMHESTMQGGMMTMNQLRAIDLPAGAEVALKPGGIHLMLINPVQALQLGDRIDLIVTFEDDSSHKVTLEVKK